MRKLRQAGAPAAPRPVLALALALLAPAASLAAPGDAPERVEVHGDWAVFVSEGDSRRCLASTLAISETGWPADAPAGPSQLVVTFAAGADAGEIAFWAAGRAIAPGTVLSAAAVAAGFQMFTDGAWAWPTDAAADAAAVAALGGDGPLVIDLMAAGMVPVNVRFSLDGVAEALAGAVALCAQAAAAEGPTYVDPLADPGAQPDGEPGADPSAGPALPPA